LQILITFILFAASQVFGRADSIGSAITIYKKIFFQQGCLFIGDAPSILIYSFLGLLMLMIKDYTDEFIPSRLLLFENKNKSIRMLSYVTVVFFILLFGVFDGGQFLYFKF
jgi:hypothetical protein